MHLAALGCAGLPWATGVRTTPGDWPATGRSRGRVGLMQDFRGTVLAAQGGDEEAFARLWREFQPGLLRYLRMKAPTVAEDLAADIWLRVLRALPTFEGDEQGFRGWIFTTARNRVTDWYRNGERRPDLVGYSSLVLLPAANNVEDEAAEHSATDRAIALIAELPADQAEAVLLRVVVRDGCRRGSRSSWTGRRDRSGCCAIGACAGSSSAFWRSRARPCRTPGSRWASVPRGTSSDRWSGSMRNGSVSDLVGEGVEDNVIALPDLTHGRLADLLQAAGGPALDYELRGESAARTAFRSAAESWPSRRRSRMRGGPAVVAATTVATMLVATTGLAAASVLPGSAGRAVDGFLGNVGVDITSPSTPAAPPAPDVTGTSAVSAPALHPVGSVHVGCTIGGTTSSGAVAGTVESSSCALTAPFPSTSHGTRSATPAPALRATPQSRPRRSSTTRARCRAPTPARPGPRVRPRPPFRAEAPAVVAIREWAEGTARADPPARRPLRRPVPRPRRRPVRRRREVAVVTMAITTACRARRPRPPPAERGPPRRDLRGGRPRRPPAPTEGTLCASAASGPSPVQGSARPDPPPCR